MRRNSQTAVPCRFSVFMPSSLVQQLDAMARAKGYKNRSHALADLVRAGVVEHQSSYGDHEIAGTLTLVYDHHKPRLLSLLTEAQHDHQGLIISALHVHLDHRNCLEVLALHGRAGEIRRMADKLIATKGVKHGKLTITTTGRES